ncbi:MAG: NUDIX hydrolase [Actinomycetota bacterium]
MGGDDHPVCGVGAVVIDGGRLLLIKRRRSPGEGLWAVPGGKVGLGETMREAAAREVREETGFEVEVGHPVWVGESIGPGDPPEWHFCLVDFAAAPVGGEGRAGDDATEFGWFTVEQARQLPLTPTMYSLLDTIEIANP